MKKHVFTLCILMLAFSISGCAGVRDTMRISEKNSQWNPVSKLKEDKIEESEPTPAQAMTVLWKESVYQVPGKKPIRGFGGRVFFYDQANNAVEANGELTIYGFDESKKDGNDTKADKKFVFEKHELDSLFSDSGLGPSYSIWLPWDEVGGMRKTIALIPMFKTEDKRILKSGQSINVLPGRVDEEAEVSENQPYRVLGSSSAVVGQESKRSSTSKSGIAQVAYESDADQDSDKNGRRMKTSTIRMTPGMSERIAMQRQRSSSDQDKYKAMPLSSSESSETLEDGKQSEPITKKKREGRRAAAWVDGLRANSGSADSDDSQPAEESTSDNARRKVFGSPGSFN